MKKEIIKETLKILMFLLTISLIFRNLGNFSNELYGLFSFLSLFIFSLLFIQSEILGNKFKFIFLLFFIFVIILFIFTRTYIIEIKIISLALFLFFCDLILRKNKIHEPILSILIISSVFFIIFSFFIKNFPLIWYSLQYFSQIFSKNIAKIIGKDLILGQTPGGIYTTIFFILFISAYSILSEKRNWKFFFYLGFFSILLNGFYLIVQFPILSLLIKIFKNTYITPIDISLIYVLLLSIPLYLLFKRKIPVKELSMELKKNHLKYLIVSMILIFLSYTFLNYHPMHENKKKNVFLYDDGYLNWNKPEFGKYGERSWGMFGMLPDFLKNTGFKVKKEKIINKETLEDTKVLVLINLNKRFNSEEKKAIWNFVEKGGSLLCLGDHTGLAGIRDPFNDLLKPSGIELNFDCGHYVKRGWKNDFEFMAHPLTIGLNNGEDTGIGVGASLKTSFAVDPVILAKYGFSDLGNPNDPRNGYLGDRRYKNGELLGDMVLVAEKRYKKGKVFVFGDTSSFQNLTLLKNPFFVEKIFLYLSTDDSNWLLRNKKTISIFLFLIALTIFFSSKLKYMKIMYVIFPLVILISYGLTSNINKKYESNILSIPKIAFIDFSHLERIDFKFSLERSIWGLPANLIRNGYNPLVLKKFSDLYLQKSKLFISISPSKRFSKREINSIKEYIKNGGIFILSVGQEEKEGSKNLLKSFGFDILNIPLGPVSSERNSVGIQFYNAWPIKVGNDAKIICSYKNGKVGYPLIVSKDYGKGKFVLIGDSNFLCDVNLESIRYYIEKNILYLKKLLGGEFFK
ncbi:MAG: hypothetical protein AB1410_02935 [Acidobacteriota bacterium]